MFERECTLYAFVLGYAQRLVADLDEAEMAVQPAPGMNPPAWILGHLAIATDYALRLLGEATACPRDWHVRFGPGSVPPADPAAYPSKAELMAALERGHERVDTAARRATPERLEQPHGVEIAFLKEPLPTVGDLLAHLMTTHEAAHLGQLSAWRRLQGKPGVLTL